MKKRNHPSAPVLRRRRSLQPGALARSRAMGKQAAVIPADVWLDRLIRRSPAFQSKVAVNLAAVNAAQDLR